MMSVVVADGALRISWEQEPRWRHDDYCAALREISGVRYDPNIRSWLCPLRNADRILEAFPHASYDYDAICAAVDAASGRVDRFMRNLRALGVRFEERAGHVLAFGDNVSPLVRELVAERNAAARAWLAENPEVASASGAPATPPACSAEEWRQAELLAASLHNAARNQYRQERRWKNKGGNNDRTRTGRDSAAQS